MSHRRAPCCTDSMHSLTDRQMESAVRLALGGQQEAQLPQREIACVVPP